MATFRNRILTQGLVLTLLAVTLAIRPVAGAGAVPGTISGVSGATAEWWTAAREEIHQDMAVAASTSSGSANWSATVENEGDDFGLSAGAAGDVNGDGYADVVVGARGFGTSGKAYVYHGSPSGLSTSANWSDTGETATDDFGYSVGTAGDVNGDGKADLVVGARGHGGYTGKAYVYHGSASGLSASADWTATGETGGDNFGYWVGTAGDVDDDGYADLVIGARGYSSYTGKAYVYLGSGSGLSSSPDWTATGEGTNNHFGISVGTAGDVNGDGKADLVAGANAHSTYTGKAYVYHGHSLDSPGAPDSEVAQMVTLEQISERLDAGTAATKMTEFTEPASGPVLALGKQHTLNEIMDKANAPAVVVYGPDVTNEDYTKEIRTASSTACCPEGSSVIVAGYQGLINASCMYDFFDGGLQVRTYSEGMCTTAVVTIPYCYGILEINGVFRAFAVCDPND